MAKREADGVAFGFRIKKTVFAFWLGFGYPVWWKPKVIGRGHANYGFGFGWLLACFRIQVFVHSDYFNSWN